MTISERGNEPPAQVPHDRYRSRSFQPVAGGPVQGRHHREAGPVRLPPGSRLAHAAALPGGPDADRLDEGPGLAGRPTARTDVPELPGHVRAALCADQLPVRRPAPDRVRALPGLGHREARRGQLRLPGRLGLDHRRRLPGQRRRYAGRALRAPRPRPRHPARLACLHPWAGAGPGLHRRRARRPAARPGRGQGRADRGDRWRPDRPGMRTAAARLGLHRHPLDRPEPVVPQHRRLPDGQRALPAVAHRVPAGAEPVASAGR